MGLRLLEGEQQIMEGKANKSGLFGARGGKLVLTNQRLLFVDHGFNIRQGGDETKLKDIMSVDPATTFMLVMPIPMPTSIKVRQQSGKVSKYVVTKRSKWVEEISRAMNS